MFQILQKKKIFRLPNRHWSWTYEEWAIDYSNADVDGWAYATDITANYEVADKEETYNKYVSVLKIVLNMLWEMQQRSKEHKILLVDTKDDFSRLKHF